MALADHKGFAIGLILLDLAADIKAAVDHYHVWLHRGRRDRGGEDATQERVAAHSQNVFEPLVVGYGEQWQSQDLLDQGVLHLTAS